MTVEIGQVIDGKYKIIRVVGEGGMGAVYEGQHIAIGRKVAVKVLHPDAAKEQDLVTRFEREAQAAARIGNDHILDVLDVGSLPGGSRYMICEFLEGQTLAARLQQRRQLSPAEATAIALQLLNGLGAAHAAGVLHRDLKPDNIFLLHRKAGISDFVKIIDFGISKFQPLTGETGMRMTATGIVMGTPYYLSPEHARGMSEADHRSDLYTVGVILYEAVTGRLPFSAQNFNDLLFKIVLETPTPPNEVVPGLDPAFSGIVMKAMARNPNERFQSAAEFMQALEQWGGGLRDTGSSRRTPPSLELRAGVALTPRPWSGTLPSETSPVTGLTRKTSVLVPLLLGGGGLLVMAVVGIGIYALASGNGETNAAASGSATATAPAAIACKPDEKRCSDNGVQTCGSNGRWERATACENQVCVNGACIGECAPGSKQCSGDAVQTCAPNGAWGASAKCVNQACVDGACAGECTPATTRCTGSAVQTCSATGKWSAAADCSKNQTCQNGQCVGKAAPPQGQPVRRNCPEFDILGYCPKR